MRHYSPLWEYTIFNPLSYPIGFLFVEVMEAFSGPISFGTFFVSIKSIEFFFVLLSYINYHFLLEKSSIFVYFFRIYTPRVFQVRLYSIILHYIQCIKF